MIVDIASKEMLMMALREEDSEIGCAIHQKESDMDSYLSRYLAGDCEQVWIELNNASIVLNDEFLYEDTRVVAYETMRRARHNVETIVHRLKMYGYWFEQYSGYVHIAPQADVNANLSAIEQYAGSLPLSIKVWYEQVGQVNLSGTHPSWQVNGNPSASSRHGWSGAALTQAIMKIVTRASDEELVPWLEESLQLTLLDPFQYPERFARLKKIVQGQTLSKETMKDMIYQSIYSIVQEPEISVVKPHIVTEPLEVTRLRGVNNIWRIDESYADASCNKRAYPKGTNFILIGNDAETRAGMDSDGVEGIVLDGLTADGWMLCNSWREKISITETFVQYLRRSFRWGGFPGFANVDESLRPIEMLKYLKEGLLPI